MFIRQCTKLTGAQKQGNGMAFAFLIIKVRDFSERSVRVVLIQFGGTRQSGKSRHDAEIVYNSR